MADKDGGARRFRNYLKEPLTHDESWDLALGIAASQYTPRQLCQRIMAALRTDERRAEFAAAVREAAEPDRTEGEGGEVAHGRLDDADRLQEGQDAYERR